MCKHSYTCVYKHVNANIYRYMYQYKRQRHIHVHVHIYICIEYRRLVRPLVFIWTWLQRASLTMLVKGSSSSSADRFARHRSDSSYMHCHHDHRSSRQSVPAVIIISIAGNNDCAITVHRDRHRDSHKYSHRNRHIQIDRHID